MNDKISTRPKKSSKLLLLLILLSECTLSVSHGPLKHSVLGSSAGQPGKVVSLTVLVLAEESPSLKQAEIAEAPRSVQDLQDLKYLRYEFLAFQSVSKFFCIFLEFLAIEYNMGAR